MPLDPKQQQLLSYDDKQNYKLTRIATLMLADLVVGNLFPINLVPKISLFLPREDPGNEVGFHLLQGEAHHVQYFYKMALMLVSLPLTVFARARK